LPTRSPRPWGLTAATCVTEVLPALSSARFLISPDVAVRYPDYGAIIVVADDLRGGASNETSDRLLREAELSARKAFGERRPADDPHVASWREAYSSFGAKPSRYPCSAEALLKRVLRGDDLPRINTLVDLYNAVSLRFVIPVGGEDLARTVGSSRLRFAAADESSEEPDDPVAAGEVVWADDEGITCRRWNWRQGRRTRLTDRTRSAYFLLERLAPLPLETLDAAAVALQQGLEEMGEKQAETVPLRIGAAIT
jgi:DNA/RNA-binding domain of Phe-tRNA-synthetase-like protein